MSGTVIEHEYEQVIDAFASEDTDEIVHVILNKDENETEFSTTDKERNLDQGEEETAIFVPPLLTTGRDQERISISMEEIKRRIEPPESLCTTNLLNLLHLSKQRMADVKETLSQYGMTRISKRSGVVSSFTKLSETEASHLAEDYYFLTSRSLNLKEIGEAVAQKNGGWDQFESQANDTKALLEQILSEVETKDTDLNLVSHGFSPLIIRSIVDVVAEILTPKDTGGSGGGGGNGSTSSS